MQSLRCWVIYLFFGRDLQASDSDVILNASATKSDAGAAKLLSVALWDLAKY